MERLPVELHALIASRLFAREDLVNLITALRLPFAVYARYQLLAWCRRRRQCTYSGDDMEMLHDHEKAFKETAAMYLRHKQFSSLVDVQRAAFDFFNWMIPLEVTKLFASASAHAHSVADFALALDLIYNELTRRKGPISFPLSAKYECLEIAIYKGAKLGKEDIVRYYIDKYPRFLESGYNIFSLLSRAAESGNASLVSYVLELCTDDMMVQKLGSPFRGVAQSGSIEIAELMVSRGIKLINRFLPIACDNGHQALLEWSLQNGWDFKETTEACSAAALSGKIELVKMLHERGYEYRNDTMENAAYSGSIPLVEWLLDQGLPRCEAACESACRSNKLEMLQFLIEKEFPTNNETVLIPLRMCFKELGLWVLRHVNYNGDPKLICETIAIAGDEDLLRCARLVCGYPWNEEVCNLASENGNIELLEWAVDHGCPWSPEQALERANEKDQKEVMHWIRGGRQS